MIMIKNKKIWMIPILLITVFITGCSGQGHVMDGDEMLQINDYNDVSTRLA